MASTNSKLENVVRQNDQVWHSLHDLKCTYPVVKGANKNDPPKVSFGVVYVLHWCTGIVLTPL